MFQRAVSALLVIGMTVFSAEAGGSKKTLMSSTNGDKITVTTVFDNYGVDVRLAKRWGFAAVISTPSATMLFDAGDDGATLLSNMKILGIDPRGIDSIVISHIHADHIGGLRDFLRTNSRAQVFIPRSFPEHVKRTIGAAGARPQDVSGPASIAPGVHTTGPLGTSLQEQALVVETGEGLVVITGCAHPGIAAVVRKARAMSAKPDIALVMGGFHLLSALPNEIDEIVRSLHEL